MSRLIARAENWEQVYTAYTNINFSAFDFNTVKRSLIDYIKLYFPESYNDFIESSELIAILELFAYVSELLAYRLDIDAHENFLSTAQRKESVLRLAKLISYTADRQLPARGLVKITSVSTTETVLDSFGTNLSNRIIRWNDITNPYWKDQFILVMNKIMEQSYGSVNASDRFQLDNVLFEIYSLGINPITPGVYTYSASVNGQSLPMELVPVEYNKDNGIIERRPYNNSNFTILYGQDGLGDTSDTTGFFCFTKQGTLQRYSGTFDGVTPNQIYEFPITGINETDIWVNNIDPITGAILDDTTLLNHRDPAFGKTGEWIQVDVAHAQNVIFNTNPRRNKYEIETRDNSGARVIFGDGEFANIPTGTFNFWARTSVDQDIIIPQASVTNKSAKFSYTNIYNQSHTFSFTFSLVDSLQNNSAAEDIEHIRTSAPAAYYSQNRMVNGQDYNTFMLQDSSILKLRSVNRTFVGDSKYINWHDPSTTYENVKMFGNDGVIYFAKKSVAFGPTESVTVGNLIDLYIEPLLSSTDMFMVMSLSGVDINTFSRTFTSVERTRLSTALGSGASVVQIDMYYNVTRKTWFVINSSKQPSSEFNTVGWTDNGNQFITYPLISISQLQSGDKYTISWQTNRLIFQSPTTKFWNVNSANTIIDYSTLNSVQDKIVVLQANSNNNRDTTLKQDWKFNILGLETFQQGTNLGLPDTSKLSIIPVDENNDGVPDYLNISEMNNPSGLADIMQPKIVLDLSSVQAPLPLSGIEVLLPVYYIVGQNDVTVRNVDSSSNAILGTDWYEDAGSSVSNIIRLINPSFAASVVNIIVNDYVYFVRYSTEDEWSIAPTTIDSIASYSAEAINPIGLWKREIGRSNINFVWFHHSPQYHLIDPATTNIIDMFIIQKGYFLDIKRWLEDSQGVPVPPTSLDLRMSYNYLLDNKMISDTVVLHPGKIKLIFGSKAALAVQARFKIVKTSDTTLTDNQIKTIVVTTIRNFFDITTWEFGETFYFTELSTAIHAALPLDINTIVLVPQSAQNYFGDLFQIKAREDEILYPDIGLEDIDIVTEINANTLKMAPSISCPIQSNIFIQPTEEYGYDYYQQTPTITWTIYHELGFYPIVRVYSTAVPAVEIVPTTVTHPSVVLTVITFSVATAGYARLV